jgi:preprotein translocase subunit SecE
MAQAAKLNKEEADNHVSGFSLMAPVGKLAEYPRRLRSFLHDVRVEMRQVNWPSRSDVISTTMVVIVTVTFFGLYFVFTDWLSSHGIGWLINHVKH